MADVEFRCFIGGLAWSTTDRGLRDAFEKFGRLTEAKVVVDRYSGRSRGFGFITFDDREAMEDAIEAMNGIDLDGRAITVDKAQPGGGRDRDDRDRGGRDYGGGRGSNGGGCYQCGKPGHFARECPSGEGGRGDRYGGGGSREDRYGGGGSREDRYGGGGREDRYGGGREDRYGGGRDDRYGGIGGRDDRYGGKDDRYGGGGSGRYGPDRNGDRYGGGRSRDVSGRGAPGGDRYSSHSRDRSGPYDRAGAGGAPWFNR